MQETIRLLKLAALGHVQDAEDYLATARKLPRVTADVASALRAYCEARAKFHATMAAAIVDATDALRERTWDGARP